MAIFPPRARGAFLTRQEMSARRVAREAEAHRLRGEGMTYPELGRLFGVSKARAWQMVRHHRKMVADGPA